MPRWADAVLGLDGYSHPRGFQFLGSSFQSERLPGPTPMAVTIEDLYRCYGVLADAKDPSQVGGREVLSALAAHYFIFSRSFSRLCSDISLTQQKEQYRPWLS